jgi:hypothetical protein
MPAEVKSNVTEFFKNAKFENESTWSMHRTLFSSDNEGNTHVICLMSLRTPEDKFNIYTFSMANSIVFAANVTVVSSSTSSWFGLFNKTEHEIISVPQNLTEDDMIAVSDYFDMVIYDRFLKFFNNSRLQDSNKLSDHEGTIKILG